MIWLDFFFAACILLLNPEETSVLGKESLPCAMLTSGNTLVLPHLGLYYVAELIEPSLYSAAVLSPPEKLGALNQVELSTSTVKLCFIP